MKIALIGYGKMGQMIDEVAGSYGVEVVARIDPIVAEADWREITPESVADAEVCIDFSHPDILIENVEKLATLQKSIVIGTSGWYEELETVKAFAQEYEVGILYAQNFSIGMNLFIKVVEAAAKLVDGVGDYDVALSEIHHNQKADSPSGTALAIAEALLENICSKDRINSNLVGQVAPEELHVSSIRVGKVPGTHTVIFDSERDTITMTHQAHHRSAWAYGALQAAKWIQDKKGVFSINDMMGA